MSVEMKESPGHGHPEVIAMSFVSGGNRLAVVSQSWPTQSGYRPRYQLEVWDADTGKSLLKRMLPMENWPARFTADGRTLIVRAEDRLLVLDVATGRHWTTLSGGLREPVAWSPDGEIVAASFYAAKDSRPGTQPPRDPKRDSLWSLVLTELASGKTIRRIAVGKSGLPALAYSPDGRTLAATTADGFRLWDSATGKEVYRRPVKSDVPGYSFVMSLLFLPHGERLATGLWDGTTLLWDLEPKRWYAGLAGKDRASRDLERLWTELAGEDAAKAYQAEWTLAAVPSQAVPFLKERLHPAAVLDAKLVQRSIADLDSEEFAVRDAAEKKLASFGEQAEPALRIALEGKPSLEARKRLEELHSDAESASHGIVHRAELLRALRAIRVLEHIGDRDAQQVLQKISTGDAAARTTRQAKEALQRLQRRTAPQRSH